MKIEITLDARINLYTLVAVIGGKEVGLECLSEDEVNKITVGELKELAEQL